MTWEPGTTEPQRLVALLHAAYTALAAADALVQTITHTTDCEFAGCTCEATSQMAEALSEYRRWRRLTSPVNPSREPQGSRCPRP